MKKVLKIFLWIFVIIVILVVGGCAASLFVANEAVKVVDESITEAQEEQETHDAILKEMFDQAVITENKGDWSHEVIYTVTNSSDITFDYIEIEYSMLDKDGVKLGSGFDNITDIAPGQAFKVTIDLYLDGAETYVIDEISSSAW